jgi:S-adenosylmethionine:tRNA ribosyltransferase-isomerase
MKLSDFDYELPRERIAQRPAAERDASRLLLLDRRQGTWEDHTFRELPWLLRGDELLVVNNTRVIAARLFGKRRGIRSEAVGRHSRVRREHLQAEIEVLLTRQLDSNLWRALVRPGRKIRLGERIVFGEGELEAEVVGRGELGLRELRFSAAGDLEETMERLGHVPLPPYVDRPDEQVDRERYQTVFARQRGAVAAPTAGLHFTPTILGELRERGIEIAELTLHVGLGTFQRIHVEELERHRMDSEAYEIPEATAMMIERARRQQRPVVAVGTTVVRALEDAASKQGPRDDYAIPMLHGRSGEADIFIRPGHGFRIVDQVLTNFHLPKSSLLVMVSAFAGRELVLAAYRHAIQEKYRFYSYGDCMLIR